MKSAFVTGADGFIGSHLVDLLLAEGYRVKALAQYNSFNDWGWLESIPQHENLEIITGDIRDPHFCKSFIKGVDVVFHLAALIAIPYSYIAPDSYVQTNVIGTLNVLQAAKENGGIRVIQTSTSEIYGTAISVPIDESHPKQPQSPYSASKIGADAMAMSFFNAFGLPVTIARPFNTYGPRQSARAIIPSIIIQIASGVEKIKVGNLTPTRDFNFVKDTCAGFIALAECDRCIGSEINIASCSEISMYDTLHIIKDIMGRDVEFVTEEERLRPDNSEVFRLYGSNKKIAELTGYSQKYSIEMGLKETIEWFSDVNNLKRYKAGIYNI